MKSIIASLNLSTLFAPLMLVACSNGQSVDVGHDGGESDTDAAVLVDVGVDTARDSGEGMDASVAPDAGTNEDAALDIDSALDAGQPDAPAQTDAGSQDAGFIDVGRLEDGAIPHVCQALGGICGGFALDCAGAGGTPLPQGDPSCRFTDGPGRCCLPPPPSPTGSVCQDRGGLCVPLPGCNFVQGSFGPYDSDCDYGAFQICCLREEVCGSEDVLCCDVTSGVFTTYRPSCDRGTFSCDDLPGTVLMPLGMCGRSGGG